MPRFDLIDDEIWALADMQALLRQFAIVEGIRTFTDARKALETILSDPPDVVFTDLRMDHMSGRALISAIREKGFHGPIVIISAYSDFEVAREALTYGVFDYLLKPVSRESLNHMMARLAEHLHVQRNVSMPERLRREVATAYPECRVLAFSQDSAETVKQIEAAASGPCALRFDPHVHQGMNIAYLSNPAEQLPAAISQLGDAIGMSCPRQGFAQLPTMLKEAVLCAQYGLRFAQNKRIREIQSYLALHYEQPLKLDELAARFYMNKTYLCEMFKKECGVTVVTYLRDIRIEIAAHRLRHTGDAISQIAAGVGYTDGAYFTRIFRSIYGVSPETYRRKNRV